MSEARLRSRGAAGLARAAAFGRAAALGVVGAVATTALWLVLPGWAVAPAATASGTWSWASLSPSSSPPPLQYASAVYDSDNHTIVVFGGVTARGSLSDSTWVWNGTTWIEYSPAQIEEPPARYLASMAFDPALHQLILFGGRNAAGRQLGDTWAWNGASWYNVGPKGGASPSARDGAAFTYDGQGHLLLFGGEAPAPDEALPSLVPPPGSASQGARAVGDTPTSNPPPQGGLTLLADTWEWGGGGWTQAASAGPPARLNAAAALDATASSVVLFGGSASPTGSSPATTSVLGDTWTWTGSSWLQASPAASPPGRAAAVIADDPLAGGPVLFGGGSAAGPLADTWGWNGSNWSQLAPTGSPGARSGAVGAFMSANGQLLVFGGAGGNGSLLGNTIVLADQAPLSLGTATTAPNEPVGAPGGAGSTASTDNPTPKPTNRSSAPPRSRALASGSNSNDSLPVLRRGQLVTLHGSGFTPGGKVTITFHPTPVVVGTTSADASGGFVATVPVPDKAVAGTHRFEGSGMTSKGESTVVLATVEIAAPQTSSRPSAQTTAELVGVALVLPLGTWLLLGARGRLRRRIA